jgi:hypothetical protein
MTLCVTAIVAPATPASAEVLLVARHRSEVGPLGPITVIGDSVLLGSVHAPWGPTLDDQLIARGWGPVRVRAGVGLSTGAFATGETTAPYWIQQWRTAGWDPVDVMVNVGANDSATCEGDTNCAYRAIMKVVDAIGPGHRIWWPKITHHPVVEHRQFAWNGALDRVAAERTDFFTWDWPAVMASGGFRSPDFIHLDAAGYRLRSELMAREITADMAIGRRTGSGAVLPVPAGVASGVVAVGPKRVLDTRVDRSGPVRAGTSIVVDVSADIPAGATAVAVYVTATGTTDNGYLTAYECGTTRPLASSVNHRRGATRGAVTITPVTTDGTFCLYSRATAHAVVDLQAAFVPADTGGSRFTPLTTPTRLVDTRTRPRPTGKRQIIEVAVPGNADMAAVSIAAINGRTSGFLVAYPCTDKVPLIATVNYGPGEVISGSAFVPVSPTGTICVSANTDIDVTIDLTGTFSTTGDLVFVPVAPTRTIDTRNGTGGWSPIHGRDQTIDARVAPSTARAVTGTLTIVQPLRTGYLRAWGCGPTPTTANVTANAGDILANSLTTGVDPNGRLCVYARNATTTVFDTTGWWTPT